jgi:hypothetical protein
MKVATVRVWTHSIALAIVNLIGAPVLLAQDYVRASEPQLFSYNELVELGSEPLSPELAEKLKVLTTTPFISNEAYDRGGKPRELDRPLSSRRLLEY